MKEVMCIIDAGWWSGKTLTPTTGPAYGQICIVIQEVQVGKSLGYYLEGWGDEPYDAVHFIPLSKPAINIEEEQLEIT